MKDSARLQTVIELLSQVEKESRPSDGILSAYFRAHRFIGSKDRTAIAQRVYAMLRHHARLEWWVNYLKHEGDKTRVMTLVFLRLVEKLDARATETLFDGDKYAPRPLSSEEKAFLKNLEGRTLKHPDMPEPVRLECPEWAYEKLKAALGGDFEKEMQASLQEAPLDLRINILKTSRDAVLEALRAQEIEASATPHSELGVRVKGRPAIAGLDIFKQGWIEIQDEGSQMVAQLAAVKPGMSVVDFCAGAGGKTLALAASMRNKGRVVACDVLGKRLKRARDRFTRAGLDNIEVRELSSENDDWVKRSAGKYDVVLVDAPCSGSGVWRRNPDARWKNLGPGLEELTALQARILNSAARLVKKGGKLIYATCSLLPEENEKQVEIFLTAHADFSADTAFLKLTPAQHSTDGFFGAVLHKKTS